MRDVKLTIEGPSLPVFFSQLLFVAMFLLLFHALQMTVHVRWTRALSEHLAANVAEMRAHSEAIRARLSQRSLSAAPNGPLAQQIDPDELFTCQNNEGIRLIQQKLNEKGFYKGRIDGRLNNGTAKAVADLKIANGYRVERDSSIIDSSTLFLLGLKSN